MRTKHFVEVHLLYSITDKNNHQNKKQSKQISASWRACKRCMCTGTPFEPTRSTSW